MRTGEAPVCQYGWAHDRYGLCECGSFLPRPILVDPGPNGLLLALPGLAKTDPALGHRLVPRDTRSTRMRTLVKCWYVFWNTTQVLR